MAARRLRVANVATRTVRIENGLIIDEDTAATGTTTYYPLRRLAAVQLVKQAGANDTINLMGPAIGTDALEMADADALEFFQAVQKAAGFAENGTSAPLEE